MKFSSPPWAVFERARREGPRRRDAGVIAHDAADDGAAPIP
jgi:hypothetical protein